MFAVLPVFQALFIARLYRLNSKVIHVDIYIYICDSIYLAFHFAFEPTV